MSVTQTANASYYNTLSVLADYELHHSSEPADPPHTNELEAHPAGDANINPPTWDTQHNRVPPHRPTNPNLDLSTRAVYLNRVEQGFVTIMFTGVFTVHVGVCSLVDGDCSRHQVERDTEGFIW